MEGNQVTMFVTCLNQEAVITLSEYDTVEELKREIDVRWHIPVKNQHITGWDNTPSSDDTILQLCCQSDINCLEVKDIGGTSSTSGITQDDSMDIFDMEIAAITSLKQKLPSNIRIQERSLSNAISSICNTTHKKQALLIYLHNSEDLFSQDFLSHIHDEEIKYILKEFCVLIGWDVEDSTRHDALLRAVRPYSELSFLPDWICRRLGGLICLLPAGSGITVFFALNRNNSVFNIIKEYLRNMQRECIDSDEFIGTSECSNHTNFAEQEIAAVESLKKKLPSHIAVTFATCSLDDAIQAICSPQLDERKILLLYLHNSCQPFSQMFIDNLRNEELMTILNKSFLILGWNIEDSEYHDALDRALSRYANLTIVSDIVQNKGAIALCILPVNDTISVFQCLRGKISLKDFIKSLKNVEKVFKNEIEKERELRKLEEETKQSINLNAEKMQSIWADMLGDRDYDSFEFDEHKYLKQKIGFGLKGPPKKETGYTESEEKEIDRLFRIIIEQSQLFAEYKDHIEIAFIFNCLVPLAEEKLNRAKNFPDYKPNEDMNPVPVFILRKCRGGGNSCRIFIDSMGRVYENWQDYLTQNKYPKCEMVVPLDGRYQVIDNEVLLEKHLSPACHLDTKLLQVGDIISTTAGFASGAIFITATVTSMAAMPIIAPSVLIGATVAGAVSGVWAIGRSVQSLVDKNKHKESMSFANSEARGAYLNIVAGSLGFVGAGATMTLTQCVQNGINIGKSATYAVNTIGALTISAGGASLVNSTYEVIDQWISKKEAPSTLTILQLGSSVLFFGHAVYNFKGAQTIIDETQTKVLQDYQDSLRSNRHRKTFNRLLKETIKTQGDGVRGKAEVIAAIRQIPNKNEVFAALTRNTKTLNKAGVRYSVEGGKITFGGFEVDMNKFISLNKSQTKTYLSTLGQNLASEQPISLSKFDNFKSAINRVLSDIKADISGINTTQFIDLAINMLRFCNEDTMTKVINATQQSIHYIFTKISRHLVDEIDVVIPKNTQFGEFLGAVISFFSEKVEDLEAQYLLFKETKDKKYYHPLFEIINPLYAKRAVKFFDYVVKVSFSGENLMPIILRELSQYLVTFITKKIVEYAEWTEKTKRRDEHSAGLNLKRIPCSLCKGYYFQHQG
ncbi:uncharacterized protein [Euwallacea fornicatus]|uniref:uncharacterized protein n=1 Tax=Euwallacea fornicatus TaxID=995702 RepID=UPI00338E5E2C